MKYKVGDIVKIKSFLWYNENYPDCGGFMRNSVFFSKEMSHYCGEIATITKCNGVCYKIDVDGGDWSWHDWMLEDGFEVQKGKDIIPNVLKAESLEEKRFHAACSAMNGILSTEYSKTIPNDKIVQMSYMLADEILKQGGFTE